MPKGAGKRNQPLLSTVQVGEGAIEYLAVNEDGTYAAYRRIPERLLVRLVIREDVSPAIVLERAMDASFERLGGY